jgi:hypothetical protein
LYINPSSVLEFERQELKTNRIRTYRFYCWVWNHYWLAFNTIWITAF